MGAWGWGIGPSPHPEWLVAPATPPCDCPPRWLHGDPWSHLPPCRQLSVAPTFLSREASGPQTPQQGRHTGLSGVAGRCPGPFAGDRRSPGPHSRNGHRIIPGGAQCGGRSPQGGGMGCPPRPWWVREDRTLGPDPAHSRVPSSHPSHPLVRSQREAAPGPRQRDRHHRRAGLSHLPGELGRASRGVRAAPVHVACSPRGLPAAGEDAAVRALPGGDLRPPAVLRRRLLPPDEREEAHLDVPRVRQAGPLRPAHHRRVRRRGARGGGD